MGDMVERTAMVVAVLEGTRVNVQESCFWGPNGCDPLEVAGEVAAATQAAFLGHAIGLASEKPDEGTDIVVVKPNVSCQGRRPGPLGLGTICGRQVSCEVKSLVRDGDNDEPPASPVV
jgi:hypothetical protein